MIYNEGIHILDSIFVIFAEGLHYVYCSCFILFIHKFGQNLVKDDGNNHIASLVWPEAKFEPYLELINH